MSAILEFERPIEISTRLKAIATELEQAYDCDPPLIPPSSRPEVNAIHANQ